MPGNAVGVSGDAVSSPDEELDAVLFGATAAMSTPSLFGCERDAWVRRCQTVSGGYINGEQWHARKALAVSSWVSI